MTVNDEETSLVGRRGGAGLKLSGYPLEGKGGQGRAREGKGIV